MNLRRRHLMPEQLAAVAVELEGAYAAEARERLRIAGAKGGKAKPGTDPVPGLPRQRDPNGRALAQAAKTVGAGKNATAALKAVRRDAPDVFALAKEGLVNIAEAKRLAQLPADRDEMWTARAALVERLRPEKSPRGKMSAGGKMGGRGRPTASTKTGHPIRHPSDHPEARAMQDGVRRKTHAAPEVWDRKELPGALAVLGLEHVEAGGQRLPDDCVPGRLGPFLLLSLDHGIESRNEGGREPEPGNHPGLVGGGRRPLARLPCHHVYGTTRRATVARNPASSRIVSRQSTTHVMLCCVLSMRLSMRNEVTARSEFNDDFGEEPTVAELFERLPGDQLPPAHLGAWHACDEVIVEQFRMDPKATHREMPALVA